MSLILVEKTECFVLKKVTILNKVAYMQSRWILRTNTQCLQQTNGLTNKRMDKVICRGGTQPKKLALSAFCIPQQHLLAQHTMQFNTIK